MEILENIVKYITYNYHLPVYAILSVLITIVVGIIPIVIMIRNRKVFVLKEEHFNMLGLFLIFCSLLQIWNYFSARYGLGSTTEWRVFLPVKFWVLMNFLRQSLEEKNREKTFSLYLMGGFIVFLSFIDEITTFPSSAFFVESIMYIAYSVRSILLFRNMQGLQTSVKLITLAILADGIFKFPIQLFWNQNWEIVAPVFSISNIIHYSLLGLGYVWKFREN